MTLVLTKGNDQTPISCLHSNKEQLAQILPNGMDVNSFLLMTESAIHGNVKLQKSTPKSILLAVLTAARLGLLCDGTLGQAYLVPYRKGRSGPYEAVFQIGYQGLITLVHRTGLVDIVDAVEVRADDPEFIINYGTNSVSHVPCCDNKSKIVSYYAQVAMRGSARKLLRQMSVKQICEHRDTYSQSYKSAVENDTIRDTVWFKHERIMSCKTVLIACLKNAPKSSADNNFQHKLQSAIVVDGKNDTGISASIGEGNVVETEPFSSEGEAIEETGTIELAPTKTSTKMLDEITRRRR